MTEQPTATVETPKRRFSVRLPSRSTATKAGALAGTFGLGVLVGVRKVRSECACESDNADTAGQTTV